MSSRGRRAPERSPYEGLLVVDKPAGRTSHDVVARVRRLVGSRRVGHAGTLDPMATGVLLVGVERATRLLGHLALSDKAYEATVRLGRSTDTDDAEGETTAAADAGHLDEMAVGAAMVPLTGRIAQVPAMVSAVKVDGVRAYVRARAGEQVELAPRQVSVGAFVLRALRRQPAPADGGPPVVDLDVGVECSSGTYVRALARDLGTALGVGGHVIALRRTRVGPYDLALAQPLAELEQLAAEGALERAVQPLAAAVAAAFPRREVDAEQARLVSHGGRLPAAGTVGTVGVFGPDGSVLALVEERDGAARPLVVFAPA